MSRRTPGLGTQRHRGRRAGCGEADAPKHGATSYLYDSERSPRQGCHRKRPAQQVMNSQEER